MPRPAIVFIGFMGAGKSTALAAARGAGLETTEIDDLMEREFGMPIKRVFEDLGEEAFREREVEIVGGLLEQADGGAIALGGGSVLYPRVRDALARHIVVWLQVSAAEAWRRIAHSDRPLATSAADVTRLLETRLPLYEELADAVVPAGDRGIVERALPAIQALAGPLAGAKLVWAGIPSDPRRDYPIVIGEGILESWWPPLGGRRFYVCDENTRDLYADPLEPSSELVAIPAGEESKTPATFTRVLEQLAEAGMTREDHVAALGGGVVGDLAGFCAHCYQRGVPVVQLPTTLVAQVDSAIGGKTGVDLPQGKNYAGAYHQPAAVISDVGALRTLPAAELAAGYVEVLKTGLLAGGELWERARGLISLDPADPDTLAQLRDIVFHCSLYKATVVAADERDAGLRNALNLGHTVGHAIEVATSYRRYRHGEAVGLGLLAALRLSGAGGLRDEVEAALTRHGLPTRTDGIEVDAILAALGRDKKRTAAGVGFVLLSEPGAPRTGQLVADDDVRAAVEELY